jgi:eukaryotic-like serine/threonine-protein kinase
VGDREQLPQRLADRFVVEALLGEGAMGQVFRVHDELHDRTLVLKLLKPERTEPGQLQRFKREFRAAARLHHPHCVRSLELIEHGGFAMLTMEHVPAGPLTIHRWEHARDVVRLALQLLAGLDHLHAKRLIHRDLKPSNILIEPTAGPPHPRLADFGIAGVVELSHEDTAVGLVQGSLRYLAPETLETGVADPRSDLYSLGLILYSLLAGQHPFGGVHRSLREWLSIHRRGRIRPLALQRPDLPVALAELVHRLCARRPDERFGDAAAAHDAFLQLWHELPGHGDPPSYPPLLRQPYLAAPAFVGRDDERTTLCRAWDDAREGRGPTVVQVVGDAGQGKSRLLREFLVEVLDGDGVVFPSTCRPEVHAPYEPLTQLLEHLGDIEPDHDPPIQMPMVGRLAGPEDPTADSSPVSGSSDGSSMVATLRPTLEEPEDATSARLQAHARWAARMRLLCRRRPVLVILEDAQWSDPPSLQLLTTMVRSLVLAQQRGDAIRMMLVVSHRRSTDAPDLEALCETSRAYDVLTTLELSPLAPESSTALMASMLRMPPAQVPASFSAPLLAQAEGSPLYLAQMLYSLLSRGQLHRASDGRWELEAVELSAASLPRSVTKAIGEQAARLSTELKQILVAAAVLGRHFDLRPLQTMTGLHELLLLDGLDELIREGFVEDHERRYRFVHDRIRDAILEAAPESERRRLHTQAAAHLVEHDGERPSAWPTIAHHLEHARRYAEAFEHMERAARHASESHAYGVALELYDATRRLAAADGLTPSDDLWELEGDAHAALGHYDHAVEAYAQRLERLHERSARAGLLSKLGLVEYKLGNFRRAIDVLEEVLDLVGLPRSRIPLPNPVWLLVGVIASVLPARRWRGDPRAAEVAIRSRTLLAECYFMAGDFIGTARHSIAAANLARRLGPNPESVRALTLNGLGMITYGQRSGGQRQLERARDFCDQINAPESVRGRMEVTVSWCRVLAGETALGLAQVEDAWRRFGTVASAEARVHALSIVAQTLVMTGTDSLRCLHYVRRMQALAEELNDQRTLGLSYYCRGNLQVGEGRFDAAIEALYRAQALAHTINDHHTKLSAQDLLVVALTLQGDLDEALDLGRTTAEHVLANPEIRVYMGQDVGLVLAAAYARHRNHLLPPGIEPLVRRVLRRRRREALSLPTSAMGFLVAEAAWNKQAGRPFDFSAGLEHARRHGLLGQLQIGRRMAAAFDVHLPEDHTDPSLHVLTLRGADRDQ